MTKLKTLLLVVILCFFTSNVNLFALDDWQIKKSKHFIVYYRAEVPENFVRQTIRSCEDYYTKITRKLGLSRYDFWLWDDRAKIYLYKDAEEYQKQTGAPPWSGGNAAVEEKIIRTYPWARGFMDSILPHEMGHIIFREFVGTETKIPLWLDEGVAGLQEKTNSARNMQNIKRLIQSKKFIELDKLSEMGNTTPVIPDIFYAEAASLVNYIVEEFGRNDFVRFCRRLRDGEQIEEAMKRIYRFNNMSELNDAWVKSINR